LCLSRSFYIYNYNNNNNKPALTVILYKHLSYYFLSYFNWSLTQAKTLTFSLTVSQLCTEVHSTNNTALSSTRVISHLMLAV